MGSRCSTWNVWSTTSRRPRAPSTRSVDGGRRAVIPRPTSATFPRAPRSALNTPYSGTGLTWTRLARHPVPSARTCTALRQPADESVRRATGGMPADLREELCCRPPGRTCPGSVGAVCRGTGGVCLPTRREAYAGWLQRAPDLHHRPLTRPAASDVPRGTSALPGAKAAGLIPAMRQARFHCLKDGRLGRKRPAPGGPAQSVCPNPAASPRPESYAPVADVPRGTSARRGASNAPPTPSPPTASRHSLTNVELSGDAA